MADVVGRVGEGAQWGDARVGVAGCAVVEGDAVLHVGLWYTLVGVVA